MLARTPLSTRAKPFAPKASMGPLVSKAPEGKTQILAWLPVLFALPAANGEQKAECMTQTSEPDVGRELRGRTFSKGGSSRFASRTPSPSGDSLCLSEVSTSAESWVTRARSLSDVSTADRNHEVDDLRELEDIPVKNTFVHFTKSDAKGTYCDSASESESNKLLRSSSAPAIVMSCTFETLTMSELHEQGKCHPCAYLHAKSDGCRLGSECRFCHLCLPDELKTRKKLKRKEIKARKKLEVLTKG